MYRLEEFNYEIGNLQTNGEKIITYENSNKDEQVKISHKITNKCYTKRKSP